MSDLSIRYGVIDFRVVDTTPGAGSAFAPPQGWQGDYVAFMRDRFATDPGAAQHLALIGRYFALKKLYLQEWPEFTGPFASEAMHIASACAL